MSQRAIVYFQEKARSDNTTVTDLLYYDEAIRALEKRVPKLVNHEKTFWTYKHFCPACSVQLFAEGHDYCAKCGQRLDWSNYWEGLKPC